MSRGDSRWVMALMATTALAGAPAAVGAELPGGASVAAGHVAITNPNADTLRIRQSSQQGIVNWNSFSIGRGGRVVVRQPSADAALLNRVSGATPSTIAGQLRANGQVYLVNPNGIAITKSGVVRTGAFVGSTLGISDDDFLAGKRSFAGGGHSAAVTNAGRIETAPGGYAALLGGQVSNTGRISVPLGQIGLGAGEAATLDFSGDGFLQVALPSDGPAGRGALVRSSGQLRADGGRIEIRAATARAAARNAINLSGLAEARSVSGHSGAIVLGGGDGGKVRVSGRLDVGTRHHRSGRRAAHGTAGGSITVTGDDIVLRHAHLNASGNGGGTVRIGGEAHGGGALPHATDVSADRATTIRADGFGTGSGGNVVLWSDGTTRFSGHISARGGARGGDGGFAEVSGHELAYHGFTDLRAPAGAIGTLLLDPFDVTISNGTTGGGTLAGGTFTPSADNSVLNATALLNALASANVNVTTGAGGSQNGDITVAAALAWSAGTTLTLAAAGNIAINAPITATTGGLTLSAAVNPAAATITTGSAGAISIGGVFHLAQGNWVQNAGGGTLPAFSAHDFQVDTGGGTFLRVLNGDGTSGNPLQIGDVYGLQGIDSLLVAVLDSDHRNFALADNIDASGTVNWNGGAGFVPLGDSSSFSGTFDGQGHVIDGLFINRPGSIQVGLVGSAGSAAFANLGLTNVDITGGSEVGALVGQTPGATITHVFSTGTVTGQSAVGGLIGQAEPNVEGTISINQSFSSAAVNATTGSGQAAAGGLVGLVSASEGEFTIEQSYATGTVRASGASSDSAGGLIGALIGIGDTTIDQSYAAGAVSAAATTGGLIGAISAGGFSLVSDPPPTITGSFWDTQATGQASATGAGGAFAGATGLATAVFHDLTQFVPLAQLQGWNFETTWSPPSNVAGNSFYPELYTMQPVIRQIVDPNPTSTYGNVPSLANNGTIGGPGTYIFGPAGDSIDLTGKLASAATSASPIGSYPIWGTLATSTMGVTYNTVATGSGAAGASVIPQITITPRPLTVTASPGTKTYGDTFTFAGTEFGTTGLVNGDTVTSVDLASLGAAATATVAGSSYAITASNAAGTGLGNYAISYAPGALAVTAAPLTIRANNQAKDFGTRFTFAGTEFTVTGLRNADAVASATLTSAATAAGAAAGGSPYPIAISAATGTGLSNYAITYQPGSFTVRPTTPTTPVTPGLPITPGLGPVYDPPDIVPVTFGGGGGGPIISLPGTGLGPPPTLTLVQETVAGLKEELGLCERRHSHEGKKVYIECLANALDGFADNLDRHVLELPPPLRQVSAAIHRAAEAVRAAHTVAEARAAVAGAISAVRRVLVLLRAGEPATTRLAGNAIVSALQSVDARLLRATSL